MRVEDLAVVRLDDVRLGAVQHADPPTADARGVPSGLDALAARLHADQPDVRIVEEGNEKPDGVGAAANAGDGVAGQGSRRLQHLLARLAADHRLEVAHHHRVGVRADDAADDVVRVGDVRDPVADGLAHGLLERAGPRRHRPDLGAEYPHPVDVRLLAPHVLRAHVHHALHAQHRAHRRRGHAVHPRARLRHDAPLAHALCKQRLAERIVDLVRARMCHVLALEVDLRPPGVLGQAHRVVQRRRAARERLEQRGELGLEGPVVARGHVRRGQLLQGRHQRLRDEPAPEVAEAALSVGQLASRRRHGYLPLVRPPRSPRAAPTRPPIAAPTWMPRRPPEKTPARLPKKPPLKTP